MKLAGLYQEGVQIELLGDRSSLTALGESLQAGMAEAVELIAVPAEAWDGNLRVLDTAVGVGPVSIHHNEDAVTITGGPEQLAQLGRNICWFAEHVDVSNPGDHIHLEHVRDSDHYIAADALPLTVGLLYPAA